MRSSVYSHFWGSAVAASAVALLTLATGCSSSSSSGGSPTSSSGSASASSSGAGSAPAATGTPIKIGLINQGKGAVAFASVADPMVAAVKYTNAHGGAGGHPIDLDVCLDDGTVGDSAACATKLVGDKVVAVLNGEDLNNASTHSILDDAGIPMIGWNPFTAADFASKTSFWMSPGYDVFTSLIKIMKNDYHASTAGYLEPDLAAAQGPLDYMQKAAASLGLKIEPVKYNYASASYTAPVAQLVASHPDVIYTYAADATASPIIQAIRQAGFQGQIFAGTTRTFVDVLGASASKDINVQATLYDWHIPEKAPAEVQPEIKIFLDAMGQYDSGKPETAYGQWSFSATMDLMSVLGAMTSNITPASISAAMRQNTDRHNFMGRSWNCVTASLPPSPGTCVRGMQIVSFDGTAWQETGNFIDAADLVAG